MVKHDEESDKKMEKEREEKCVRVQKSARARIESASAESASAERASAERASAENGLYYRESPMKCCYFARRCCESS
jgi:hypothetical protein